LPGSKLISGGSNGILNIFNFENYNKIKKLSELNTPLNLVSTIAHTILPSSLFISSSSSNNHFSFSPINDKEYLAAAGSSNNIQVIDLANMKLLRTI
jgi:WD40 repeat protein